MKKMILSAGAFLLSSSAFAGIVHANSVGDPAASMSTAYATGAVWAMSPALQSSVVQAGMNHAGHAAGEKNVQLTAAHMAEKQSWLAQAGGTMDGKNVELTAAHMAEKRTWLAQAGGTMGGKNVALTAEQLVEKQTWLASNGNGSTELAMDAGKDGEMNGQGGPEEAVETGALPACRPGPGDDRCIQLYERGVSRAYAQWSAGRTQLGMGGPEEPVTGKAEMASATADMSMPAPKVDSGAGPTTEPTGVSVQGKSAMSMVEGTSDMAAVDPVLEDDGMAAEQMLGKA
jgi:hypothetical protein